MFERVSNGARDRDGCLPCMLAFRCLQDPFASRFVKLNEEICSVVQDYSLVSFTALSVLVGASNGAHLC